MKQRGHTWIALRAIGLIQDDSKTQNLAQILAPWAKYSYIGCWLPDMAAFRKGGVHEGWEKHWEKLVGTYFSKKKLKNTADTFQQIIDRTKDLDAKLGLTFQTPLTWPDNNNDIWETAIYWCRASFAFVCIIFPLEQYPYGSQKQPEFVDYFTNTKKLAEYDRVVLQSAVYAVASTWKQIWRKFKK